MTLSSRQTKVVYLPDGTTTVFTVPFPVFDAGDIECIAVDALGFETRITSFVVNGVTPGAEADNISVTFATAPEAGKQLVIRRNTDRVQESDYPTAGRFPAKTVEHDFDRTVGMIQELNEQLVRAVKVDATRDEAPTAAELYADLDQRVNAADAARDQAFASATAAAAQVALATEQADRSATEADRAEVCADALDIAGNGFPKAWLICARNGVIVASRNVASVTRVSAGIYTIDFPVGVFATNRIIPCGIAHLYPMQTLSANSDSADFTATRVTVTIGATHQTPRDSEFRLVFFEGA
jgi:hypothetical protein